MKSTEKGLPNTKIQDGSFLTNVLANGLNFLVQVCVGIFFTPFLIGHLGWGSYGLIPLTATLMSYLTLTTMALNSAVGRFLTIALVQGKTDYASKIFNTSLGGSIVLTLILAGPGLFLAQRIENFIHIPSGMEIDAHALVSCAIIAFLLTTITTPFDQSTYCKKRFDLRSRVNTLATLIGRVGIVVLLFMIFTPRLFHVGIGLIITAAFVLLGAIYNWGNLLPDIHINFSHFDFETFKVLIRTGGWVVISQVGTMLLLAIDLLVVNHMFGAELGGQYATVSQWSAYLRSFSGIIGGVFGPTIMTLYGKNNIKGMILYVRRATKLLGLIVVLPIGLLCGFAHPFLLVWLHRPDVAALAPLMLLISFHLGLNLGYQPLHNISIATNHVRLPGIVQIIAGVVNLGLAIFLAGPIGWGVYGVAAAGGIVLTARNLVFTPLYAARILAIPRWTFYREFIPIIIMTTGLVTTGLLLSTSMNLATLPRLMLAGSGLSLIYVVVVWRYILQPDEREKALSILLCGKLGNRNPPCT